MIAFLAARAVMMREFLAYRRVWWVFLSGFVEPVLYLFSIGIGVGGLVEGFTFNGETIGYAAFVAPAMLAASAFNGALLDSTYNFFFKFKINKLFDQQLATPLTTRDLANGNLAWMMLRSGAYSAGFLAVMLLMGYVTSWWAVLALPAALLLGFATAATGMAATTWMRSFQDFEFVTLVQLPLFLFSATFFPLSAFPTWLAWIVQLTPLYRGVALIRELTTGLLTWEAAFSVVYLAALGAFGLWLVGRRLDTLLRT